MKKKGQSDIVGFLVVTLIILAVVSTTFFWARPMLEQNNNFNDVTRTENRMIALHNAIKDVANEHGQRRIPFTINNGWLTVESNQTIRYHAFIDLPEPKIGDTWRVMIGNVSSSGPCQSSVLGDLGYDDVGCLRERGSIEMELNYIVLNDTSDGTCYGILLDPKNGAAAKGENSVLIIYNTSESGSYAGCSSVTWERVIIDIE